MTMAKANAGGAGGGGASLSRASCVKLLKQEQMGRVAFEDWDGPQLLLVVAVPRGWLHNPSPDRCGHRPRAFVV